MVQVLKTPWESDKNLQKEAHMNPCILAMHQCSKHSVSLSTVLYHFIHMLMLLIEIIPQLTLQCQIQQGTRSAKHSQDTVKKDLQRWGLIWKEADAAALNRQV